jgi:hypothetical protein
MTSPNNASAAVERWEAVLLTLFVAHTLTFALLAPPWRHYDEPTSLEYALLIRDLGRLPGYDEQIPELRSLIARSMAATSLFAGLQSPLNSDAPDITLGFNQRVHPPTYYVLIALATLPAREQPIELQLRVARLVSVALAAICFYMAVRASRLLVADVGVRIFTLTALACLPPFADIMGALNSDALVNTVAVAMIWAAAALAQQPDRRSLRIALLALIGLSFGVKRSLVAPASLLLAWLAITSFRIRWQRAAVPLAAIAILSALVLLALPQRLADWEPVPPAASVAAHEPNLASSGSATFALSRPADGPGAMAVQEIDSALRDQATGHIVTLSAQMRVNGPGGIALTPAIQVDQQVRVDNVIVGERWMPVSVSAYVPPDTHYLAVRLYGPFAPGTVFSLTTWRW